MKKKILIFMALVVLCLTALYGCSGGTDKNQSGNAGSVDESSSSKEPSYGGKPSYGGSVVVGVTQDMDSLDPHKAVAAGTKEVLFNIFEGLVKPDKEGNLVPAVASDYEMSKDGKVYTFTLRDGITFHNGALVTVEDVIYSIKRSAGLLETKDPSVVLESALSNIEEVKRVDDRTVNIVLKEGDTELIGYLTFAIIPKDYNEQNTKPIGTGPFEFVSYSPLESMVVKKYDGYWDEKKPYLDEVTFKILANTDTAFASLKAGAIDIYPYLTADQANQLSKDFNIEQGSMNLVQGLFLNNKVEPFNNPLVREALNYAIDKQMVIDLVAGGKGNIIGSNMFTGFVKYYQEGLENEYPYDPAKAKELLKEAGYEAGLKFTITVPSNYQFHVDTAQIIVEQLRQVGINADIRLIEWSAWLSDVYVGRKYQSTIVGLDAKLAPRDLMERYGSKASNNFMNYSNQEYDKVLEKAISTIDDEEKISYYKQLQTILAKDSASIYLQDPALLVAVNKKLGGYTFYPVYVQDMASVYYYEQ